LGLDWKGLAVKNVLAYIASSSVKKKKSSTPSANVIKLFSFIDDDEAKYARVFITGNPFQV
jgi:hypothetical protein